MAAAVRLLTYLCMSLCFASTILAQTPEAKTPPSKAGQASPSITLTPTTNGVRVVAQGAVSHVRLEVYPVTDDERTAPDAVVSTSFARGNLHDWALVDGQGQPLSDGKYLFVVTARDMEAELWFKKVTLRVQGGQAVVELTDADTKQPTTEQALTALKADEPPALTATVHTGAESQLVSTRGGFSFRVGNLFTAQDKEVMRLSAQGNLSVPGTISATKGIEFSDGTVQTSGSSGRTDAQGNVIPAAAGTGTQNRVAKWTDNAGTLGDAAITETSGLTLFGQNNSGQVAPLFPTAPSFHVVEVGAPGTRTPLVLAGGSASMEFWKDLGGGTGAPAAAGAFGLATPGLAATNDIVFSTFTAGQAWQERLRITNAGNVGIGTSNPLRTFQLGADTNALFTFSPSDGTPNAGYIRFGDKTGWKLHFARNRESNQGALNTGTTGELLTIQDNGNIGIGDTAPTFRLHVVDTANTGLRVQTNTGGGTVASFGGNGNFQIDAVNNVGGRLIVTENGNVGIGINAGINVPVPRAKLDVRGDATQSLSAGGFAKAMIFVNADGTIARCFNSQAAAGANSTVPCGFTVTISGTSDTPLYTIDFGFGVDNRFYSVTPFNDGSSINMGAYINSVSGTQLSVYVTHSQDDLPTVKAPFVVIIY
jgi:hypothetical protein